MDFLAESTPIPMSKGLEISVVAMGMIPDQGSTGQIPCASYTINQLCVIGVSELGQHILYSTYLLL